MYNRLFAPRFPFLHRFLFLCLFVYSLRLSFLYPFAARYMCRTFINNSDRAWEKKKNPSHLPSLSSLSFAVFIASLFFLRECLFSSFPFRCTSRHLVSSFTSLFSLTCLHLPLNYLILFSPFPAQSLSRSITTPSFIISRRLICSIVPPFFS